MLYTCGSIAGLSITKLCLLVKATWNLQRFGLYPIHAQWGLNLVSAGSNVIPKVRQVFLVLCPLHMTFICGCCELPEVTHYTPFQS